MRDFLYVVEALGTHRRWIYWPRADGHAPAAMRRRIGTDELRRDGYTITTYERT